MTVQKNSSFHKIPPTLEAHIERKHPSMKFCNPFYIKQTKNLFDTKLGLIAAKFEVRESQQSKKISLKNSPTKLFNEVGKFFRKILSLDKISPQFPTKLDFLEKFQIY